MAFKYDLTILKSRENLVDFLGVDDVLFEKVLSFDPHSRQPMEFMESDIILFDMPLFLRHEIPKKNGRGFRLVWEPTVLTSEYKALARRLNNFLSQRLDGFPHSRAFGYIGGRNIRENAKDHCGHKYLVSVDIENFFPSISASRIVSLLTSLGVEPVVADLLSRFMTIGGTIPLGLPTSPILANAILLPMDGEFDELAKKFQATFSRYADDISLSSDTELPPLLSMRGLVERHGFKVAESKSRFSKMGQAHYVTGLSISDPIQPHVPKQKKRRLRQELYFSKKYGLNDHLHRQGFNDHRLVQQEINRLDGLVKFVAFHEPRLSTYLKSVWGAVLRESGDSPSFSPKNQARTPFFIYVDEAEFVRPDGIRILALGMAVSQHQQQVSLAAQEVLEGVLSDPWAAGDRLAIVKRGLHFTDAHPDLRLAYIERMRSLPFEGYVAMAELSSASDYEATYLRLLRSVIKRRLMAAESKFACFVFEQNDKVSQEAVRHSVMAAYSSLRHSNNRHPEECFVKFSDKSDPGMSVPDFLLGALGKFLKSGVEKTGDAHGRDRKLFERIRDKYRLIIDVDGWVEYSRRREIAPWES